MSEPSADRAVSVGASPDKTLAARNDRVEAPEEPSRRPSLPWSGRANDTARRHNSPGASAAPP